MKKTILIAIALMTAESHAGFDKRTQRAIKREGIFVAESVSFTTAVPLSPFIGTSAVLNREAKQLLYAAKDEALMVATSEAEIIETSDALKSAIALVQGILKSEQNIEIDEKTAAAVIVTATTPEASKAE